MAAGHKSYRLRGGSDFEPRDISLKDLRDVGRIAWKKFEVRKGDDGESGIFLRAYNVRLATFSPGSKELQEMLGDLFELEAGQPDSWSLRVLLRSCGLPLGRIDADVEAMAKRALRDRTIAQAERHLKRLLTKSGYLDRAR